MHVVVEVEFNAEAHLLELQTVSQLFAFLVVVEGEELGAMRVDAILD